LWSESILKAKAFKGSREHDGNLKLVCPAGEVLRVLRLNNLISVIRVFATEGEAMSSFK